MQLSDRREERCAVWEPEKSLRRTRNHKKLKKWGKKCWDAKLP